MTPLPAAPSVPMMKAAVVTAKGAPPAYGDFPEPVAAAGQCIVRVTASALNHITRSRAAGGHYSSSGRFPFVAGIDGTGTRADGRRVYFILPVAPYGAMAERCVVEESHCIPLPDGIDDVAAAAIAIPGMSSWAALVRRAKLIEGEAVLINGATGTSGRLAVQIAKRLGAGRVIATGRSAEALQSHRPGTWAAASRASSSPFEGVARLLLREGIEAAAMPQCCPGSSSRHRGRPLARQAPPRTRSS